MADIYLYARVSTKNQNLERQIRNLKKEYPMGILYDEIYTGTKLSRPKFETLISKVHSGDTIVFDEVSRMSRNAKEGFALWKDMYERDINLVFLKEPAINTQNFKNAQQITMTNTNVDIILKAINEYLLLLAEEQIKASFEMAQKEVEYLRMRTKEGMASAKAQGKTIGCKKGNKNKESEDKHKAIEYIRKNYEGFGGRLKACEIIKQLEICKQTFYSYLKEIKV